MGFPNEFKAKASDDAVVAALVTSLIRARRFPLPDVLLHASEIFPQVAWANYAVFATARTQAIALGLIDVHNDESFTPTALALELTGETAGRYFHEIASKVAAWLDAASIADTSDVPVLTVSRFECALGMADDKREARRLRTGLLGVKKWGDWRDAPPLDLASCVEFLTFIAGRRVGIRVGRLDVAGLLHEPSPSPGRPGEMRCRVSEPIHSACSRDATLVILALDPTRFKTARFDSVDELDYFTLTMVFDDCVVEVAEP